VKRRVDRQIPDADHFAPTKPERYGPPVVAIRFPVGRYDGRRGQIEPAGEVIINEVLSEE
jgi:hypothetical protein